MFHVKHIYLVISNHKQLQYKHWNVSRETFLTKHSGKQIIIKQIKNTY